MRCIFCEKELPATSSYCRFCGVYQTPPTRVIPLDDVEADDLKTIVQVAPKNNMAASKPMLIEKQKRNNLLAELVKPVLIGLLIGVSFFVLFQAFKFLETYIKDG